MRLLARIILAMSMAYAFGAGAWDAGAASFPWLLAAAVAGGLAFAGLGLWAMLRLPTRGEG